MMQQVLDQPVLVRVEHAHDVLTPQMKERVTARAIEGFVFQDPGDLLRFHAAWKTIPVTAKADVTSNSAATAPLEPSILLEANPETLLRFFAEEQNFAEGNPCDGYIVTEPLSPDDAERIRDARVGRIASAHSTPLSFPKGHAQSRCPQPAGGIEDGIMVLGTGTPASARLDECQNTDGAHEARNREPRRARVSGRMARTTTHALQ